MVKHTKRLTFAVLATALAVVAGGALYAANAQVGKPMFVASVAVGGSHGGRLAPIVATAAVDIVDQAGQPVNKAKVTGRFTGCGEDYQASAMTGNLFGHHRTVGRAFITGQPAECGCVYTFTVTSVTKPGWTWNAPSPPPSNSGCALCDCD